MKALCFLIATLLICHVVSQEKHEWVGALSAVTMHSSLIFEGRFGQIIIADIQPQSEQPYTIELYRPGQYYPRQTSFQSIYSTGNTQFQSQPIDGDGFWRLEVVPANRQSMFLVRIQLTVGLNPPKLYVDVARSKKLAALYFQQGQDCSFALQDIAFGLQEEVFVEMHQGNPELDFILQKLVYSSGGRAQNSYQVTCRAQRTGYYYIALWASDEGMKLFPRVLLNYKSQVYPCPADQTYQDSNQIFEGCEPQLPLVIFPCIEADPNSKKCTKCANNFVLQEDQCYAYSDCGLDYFFDKGKCEQVISNCIDYEFIGGKCKACLEGYGLFSTPQIQFCYFDTSKQQNNPASSNLQSQPVVQPTPQVNSPPIQSVEQIECGEGTYPFDGVCVLYPQNCIGFDPDLQMCTKCKPDYTLNEYSFSCIPQEIKCPNFHTNVYNKCLPYPSNCEQTNALGDCSRCDILYDLKNGKCQNKECPLDEYLSFNGVCVKFDVNCIDFDHNRRTCVQCRAGFNLDVTRSCIPGITYEQTQTPCNPRQYLDGTVCKNVSQRCQRFNLYTGECLTCQNPEDLLDLKTGKCLPKSQVCIQGFFFSSFTRKCQEVSPFCETYNETNGNCLSCNGGLTLFRGSCLHLTPCSSNEYRNYEGMCVKANDHCDHFNKYNGSCLNCTEGYELNRGGICCFAKNYLLQPQCKEFLKENCVKLKEEVGNCLQCEQNYAIFGSILSKCKPI